MLKRVFTSSLTGAAFIFLLGLNTPAQGMDIDPVSGLDSVYSQTLPLAARSLLLDVVRLDNGRLVAVGERGHVVYSDDGTEWTQAEHVPSRSTLTAVTHYGDRLWAVGHDTTILTSGDRGQSWTLLNFDPERRQPAMDVLFVSPEVGMVVGAYGLMMITRDGGENWEERYPSEDEWHLNSLLTLDNGDIIIAGERGFSYISEDGGETFETIEMPYPGSMFGIIEVENCVVVFGLRGHVQESCGGGRTWAELVTNNQQSLSGAAYRDGELMMVGNGGIILKRKDRGPFTHSFHSSGVDFASIIPMEDGSWLLVGEEGRHRYPEQPRGDAQ